VRGYGAGLVYQYGPDRIWFIFNEVFDSDYGVRGGRGGGDIYILGNLFYDLHHGPEDAFRGAQTAWSHSAVMLAGGENRHIVGNTICNVDGGINIPSGGPCYIANNIISHIAEPQGKHVFIEHAHVASASTLRNNLFHQGGRPVRIAWGGRKAHDLAGLKATTGQGQGCIEGDPMFLDAANADFRLNSRAGRQSPAIDAGSKMESYLHLFTRLYGLKIGADFDGVSRPQGAAVDMGAFEVAERPPGR
jgi:hypothetical protein